MKYCVEYSLKSKTLDEADEINIRYDKRDTLFLDFLLKYQEKRINIRIEDVKDFYETQMDIFLAIKEKYPQLNLYLVMESYAPYCENIMTICKDNNIPYFFQTLISKWDVLRGYIGLGVSDVYIVEDLCFELDKVSKVAKANNVSIRTFPNIAQTSWKQDDDLRSFFIRPEDVILYEDYIDTFEFLTTTEKSNILFKVYKKDKNWFGKLNEIISGLNTEIDSRGLTNLFAYSRISCGKKCLKGTPCNICGQALELSKALIENNIIIKQTIDKN